MTKPSSKQAEVLAGACERVDGVTVLPPTLTAAAAVVHTPKATKQTLILDLLARPSGASLAELTAATAWLPHTVRAALVRLRQKGRTIERNRDAEGVSRYRLTGDGGAAPSTPAAAAA